MIGDEDKERVRQATDIVQLVAETVILKQRGQEFWGCCPFHNEKSPSFHVNPATGLWKCIGCGKGGDVFAYIMERENLEFPDAIRYLADRAGIEVEETRSASKGPKKNRIIECLEAAQSFFATMLMRGKEAGPAQGRSYLSKRGFGSDICRRWKLGYAPGRSMLVRQLESQGFTRSEILAADLGVKLTGAGATWPYGKDPRDTNIRIAPTFPTIEDLSAALDVFVVATKLVSARLARQAKA